MLLTALIFTIYLNQPARAEDTLAPSPSKSMEFQETPKPKGRGPASISTPEPIEFQEVVDDDTEAGFNPFCQGRGCKRTPSLAEQSEQILDHAQRAANGK